MATERSNVGVDNCPPGGGRQLRILFTREMFQNNYSDGRVDKCPPEDEIMDAQNGKDNG